MAYKMSPNIMTTAVIPANKNLLVPSPPWGVGNDPSFLPLGDRGSAETPGFCWFIKKSYGVVAAGGGGGRLFGWEGWPRKLSGGMYAGTAGIPCPGSAVGPGCGYCVAGYGELACPGWAGGNGWPLGGAYGGCDPGWPSWLYGCGGPYGLCGGIRPF